MIALMCVACKKRVTQPADFSLEETIIDNETTTPDTNPPTVEPEQPAPTPDPDPTPEPEQPTPDPEPTPEPEPTPKPEPTPPTVDPKPTPEPEPTPKPEPAPKPAPVIKIDKTKGLDQFVGKNFQEEKTWYFENVWDGTYRRTAKIEKSGNVFRLVYNDYASGMKSTPRAIYFDGKGTPTDKGNGAYSFPVYQHDNHMGRTNNYGKGDTTVVINEDGTLKINFTGGYLNALSGIEFKLVK